MLNALKGFLAGIGAIVLLFTGIVISMLFRGRTEYAMGTAGIWALLHNPLFWAATAVTFTAVFIWVARG